MRAHLTWDQYNYHDHAGTLSYFGTKFYATSDCRFEYGVNWQGRAFLRLRQIYHNLLFRYLLRTSN